MEHHLKLNIPFTEEEQEERRLYNLVPTLNKMGYMYERYTPFVNEYLKAYIDSLPHVDAPVLDIGVAYGVTVIDALRRGAHVIANEIYQPHLDLMMENVPENLKPNLTLNLAHFPRETDFPENSLGAVLISRVFNFLTGKEIELGLTKIYKWLKPGGKVYIITETVYKELFCEIIPIVHERIKDNVEWPGEIDDVKHYMTKRKDYLPNRLHFLCDKTLTRLFHKAGFTIEKCSFFSKSNIPPDARCDGKETVGIIGIKPSQ